MKKVAIPEKISRFLLTIRVNLSELSVDDRLTALMHCICHPEISNHDIRIDRYPTPPINVAISPSRRVDPITESTPFGVIFVGVHAAGLVGLGLEEGEKVKIC